MGKTIEERAVIHATKFYKEIGAHHYSYCIGATEQKAIDDKRIEELEAQLAQTSCYEEGFEEGFAVGKKETIDKACEWLMKYFVIDHEGMTASGCDVFLRKFRKAMEE